MNPSPISAYAALEHFRELRDAAAHTASRSDLAKLTAFREVSIRYAGPSDAPALAALATLDSKAAAPSGDVLVAELDGVPVAAIGVEDDAVIADPFRHTADLVQMLELRAAQLRAAATPTRHRRWAPLGAPRRPPACRGRPLAR